MSEQVPEIPATKEEEPKAEHKEPKAKRQKKVQPAHVEATGEIIEIDTGDAKQFDRVVLPESEDDPHWDPKLKNGVPEGLVENLAELGWDPSMAIIAVREGDKLKVAHGKTRWRAIEKANRLRQKAGLPALVARVCVSDEAPDDDQAILRNMERNVSLNYSVQDVDPMTTAESVARLLSAGIEEKTVAKRHNMTVNDLHGHLLILDTQKCPESVQELLRERKISFTAALELARRSEKMSASELTQAAEQIAKAAAGGVKQTTAQVKKAAGDGDEKVATKKEVKQFLLDLQSNEPGKGEWGAIVALEVGLGTRSIQSAKQVLSHIRKGKTPKIDFKQYQTDAK